jgi:tetratricopeptide (TPR) repeat protein
MAKLEIKYRLEGKALPPRPVRLSLPGWGGAPEMKKEDGSQPQPWHCPLHVEGATHGIELLYQYDQEARVYNNNGNIQFIWDYKNEPGGATVDFTLGVPPPPQHYLFATSLDIQAPPGYVMRTQPHPRFFADTTGTVPAALYGHVHSEWWPKKLFVVFKIPPVGQYHLFRKGEPYVQVLFVPDNEVELKAMTPEEAERRKKLEEEIRLTKSLIAKHVWHSAGGIEFNDHYRVLERAYEQGGVDAVERAVREAVERYEAAVPKGRGIPEYLDLAAQYQREGKVTEAKEVLHHVMRYDHRNPEVFNRIAQLEWDIGIRDEAVTTMKRALKLDPRRVEYAANLGQMLSRLSRLEEAEPLLRAVAAAQPNNSDLLSNLGVVLAQRGQAAEGLEKCRAAVAMAPQSAVAQYRLGLVLAAERKVDEARAAFQASLAADPNFSAAGQALADLQTQAAAAR